MESNQLTRVLQTHPRPTRITCVLVLPLGVEPSVVGYKPTPQNRRGQAGYMVLMSGFEPLTFTLSEWRSNQLNYISMLVLAQGVEPWTFGLRVRCSTIWAIQTYWCGLRGSNSRPTACKAAAHPSWAKPAYSMVLRNGIEPLTQGFSVPRSTYWAIQAYMVGDDGVAPPEPKHQIYSLARYSYGLISHKKQDA